MSIRIPTIANIMFTLRQMGYTHMEHVEDISERSF